MKNNKVIKLCYTAMFTAMIFVLTRFVSVPVASGYVHFGDALIYIVASTLGGPWAVFAAMVGEALADLAGGYAFYAPATLIVKALMALPFVFVYKKSEKTLTLYTFIMSIVAGVINVCGYFIGDLIIDKTYAFVDIPGNIIQSVGSLIIFVIIAFAFDKANLKKKLFMDGAKK